MSHTYARLLCHGVFSTEGRRPFIRAEWRDRLYGYLSGILTNHQGRLIRAGGTADHVHVLMELRPSICVADAMRLLKANSSKWMHETFSGTQGLGWQTGYGAFSVSPSNADAVVAYIDRQEEHHRNSTFQEEFRSLLRKHQIEFDEATVWD